MLNKPLLFTLCFSLSLLALVSGQDISADYSSDSIASFPYHTEMLDKKITRDEDYIIGYYHFRSQLSKEEIIKYYRDYFSALGFTEEILPKKDHMFYFKNGIMNSALLNVYYTDKENRTFYLLDTLKLKYVISASDFKCQNPQKLDLIPINYNYTQAIFAERNQDKKAVQYLTFESVESVANFYLKNMPFFGWSLVNQENFEGNSNFMEASGKGYDEQKVKEYLDDFPGLNTNVKVIGLSFKSKSSHCAINITQFLDSANQLKKSRIINPEVLAKYGDVLITVEWGPAVPISEKPTDTDAKVVQIREKQTNTNTQVVPIKEKQADTKAKAPERPNPFKNLL
jgi:hypothetical protein